LSSAEFYSDVDSKERDEAKALEIKAKDFWQSLMDSAQGLQTTDNARLCAKVDETLETLPPEDNDIRDLFHEAIGHLVKADSMLFEEASRSKLLALQRLENGPAQEARAWALSDWEDSFYTAITQFVGYKSYEKQLAKHVISRLKEIGPSIHHAADMAPKMLDESGKASDRAYAVLRSRDGPKQRLPIALRKLAHEIISATGKQRLRFTNYLLNSLMTTAVDIAEKDEKASKTVMKASLRGNDWETDARKRVFGQDASTAAVQSKPAKPQVESGLIRTAKKSVPVQPGGAEPPPLVFFDGVPVDAKPVADYNPPASYVDEVVEV